MPYPLILTAAGEVAVPTLLREVGKVGIKQFIKTYGSSAWQSIAGATIGGTIATKTPPLNLQNKELFSMPKGSMPTATRAEQMDAMMAVPDTTHKSVTDTPSGLVIGGEKKEPLPPPEPFTTPTDPQEPITLSTPEAEKQDTTLITPEPKKIDTTLSTPIPKESGPIIYTKDDVSEQTKKLVPEKGDTTPGIGHNQPPSAIEEAEIKEKDKSGVVVPTSLTTQDFLQPKLLNDMLKLQGGIEGHKKLFEKNPKTGFSAAPMPASTKKKMYNVLSEMIDDKYNLSKFPEGESPETVTEERLKYLQNTSSKRFEAIDYIVSAAYDVIGGPTKGFNLSDTIFVTDDEGLPMAAAKIELKFSSPKTYSKDALTITEAGSIFRNAGDQLFDAIIKRAKDEGKRFIVAEDLTSSEALEAMKRRGFKPPTTKALKPFKGRKVNRPSGWVAYQKNLVLDLGKTLSEKELLFLKDLRIWGVPERASSTLDSKIKKLSEGEKVNLTEKERFDLNGYMFTQFEQGNWDEKGETIFNSADDLELLDNKLRLKKAHGGLIDKPLTGGSRYI